MSDQTETNRLAQDPLKIHQTFHHRVEAVPIAIVIFLESLLLVSEQFNNDPKKI